MWKVNGWQTTDAKWWQKLTLLLARWAKKREGWYFTHMWETLAHDHITSLRGEVWAHRTSLIPSLYIEVPVLKPGEWRGICTCIRGIHFIYVCTIFRLYLGTVLTVWYYYFYCKAILFVLGLGFGIIFFYCKAILFVLGLGFGIIIFIVKLFCLF